ncbi:MAG: VOC family protein [Chloroflexi bacterium]|nr:VOC family protein [Chloroflexota bacterium]
MAALGHDGAPRRSPASAAQLESAGGLGVASDSASEPLTAGPAAPGPGIQRVGQIGVRILDLDRAVAFYRDVLGLPLLFQAPPGLAFFQVGHSGQPGASGPAGGVRLMLSRPESAEHDHPGSIVYYEVADLHAAWAAVTGRGAPAVAEPHLIARMPDHDLWMAFINDSEGNLLGLMSEVRPPSSS